MLFGAPDANEAATGSFVDGGCEREEVVVQITLTKQGSGLRQANVEPERKQAVAQGLILRPEKPLSTGQERFKPDLVRVTSLVPAGQPWRGCQLQRLPARPGGHHRRVSQDDSQAPRVERCSSWLEGQPGCPQWTQSARRCARLAGGVS